MARQEGAHYWQGGIPQKILYSIFCICACVQLRLLLAGDISASGGLSSGSRRRLPLREGAAIPLLCSALHSAPLQEQTCAPGSSGSSCRGPGSRCASSAPAPPRWRPCSRLPPSWKSGSFGDLWAPCGAGACGAAAWREGLELAVLLLCLWERSSQNIIIIIGSKKHPKQSLRSATVGQLRR